MRSFVYVECGLLRESLEAHVALVGALAGVRAVVYLEVLLAGEGGRALQALERPALHCKHTGESTRALARAARALLRSPLPPTLPHHPPPRTYPNASACGCSGWTSA